MNEKNSLLILITIGFVTFFLIEAFYNTCLYINSLLFINLGVIKESLPWILLYLAFIFGILILFGSKLIKEQFKLFSLIFVIVISRIIAQFYFIPEIYLLSNLTLLLTSLLFFLEIFLLCRKMEFLKNFEIVIGGIILGLGINYAFYIFNITSNLTTEISKLPFTIIFGITLIILNIKLFHPNLIGKRSEILISLETKPEKQNLTVFHFFIGGFLFFFSLSWIFSPSTLSAYDTLNLEYNNLVAGSSIYWPSFGFIYYIFIILISLILSFIIIKYIFMSYLKKLLKPLLLFLNISTLAINALAILIIDNDYTILSTIYLTILCCVSSFTILFNFSYIIQFYSIQNRIKAYIGIFLFTIGLILAIIVEIIITWLTYASMLYSIIAFSIFIFPCLILLNLKKVKLFLDQKIPFSSRKFVNIFLGLILIVNLFISWPFITHHQISTPSLTNPTFMVWNIHNAVGVDREFDADRIVDVIKTQNPDVVGLNEVDMGFMKTGFIDLASYIAHKLNMYFYYGPSYYKHYGNAILSKYPIMEAETFRIPRVVEGAEPRGVIRARINVSGQIWTIYVTHLSTQKADRLAQVDYNYSNSVVSIINQSEFIRTVWMGDFNCEPSSEEYNKLNASALVKFRDSYPFVNSDPGYTGGFDDNAIPHRRIDYILCSPDLIPTESQVICSLGSDHCAVKTTF